ncbi:cyclic nucleotide-binding domain-containing protein [Actinomadura geliboluensis]|uniref:cyclic nucleotide-binding domain-containing protein n=1 Tax=Actinomadura geliboluensis TaxID=882440 RepID=UPI003717C969
MDAHARRHDPDQIVHPETLAVVRPRRPHGERPAESTDLESRPAGPPVAVRPGPGAQSRRPGFWTSLTTIERAEFLATAQEVVYPAGAVLWEEDEAADQTIVIKTGTVRVSVRRDGGERIIAFRGPGDIIGERAALLLRRRSATVVAMEPLSALLLTTQQFVTYLSNHPRVVAVLEREMYERLTEQTAAGPKHDPRMGRPYGDGASAGAAGGPPYGAGGTHPYGVGAQAYESTVQYGLSRAYTTAFIPLPLLGPNNAPLGVMEPNTVMDPYDPYTVFDLYPEVCECLEPAPFPGAAVPYAETDHAAETGRYASVGAGAQPKSRTGAWTYAAETSDLVGRPQRPSWRAHPAATVRVQPHGQAVVQPASRAATGPAWAGRNCTVVYTDIAGFSSRARDEHDRIEVRRAMYAALRESFEGSGVPWDTCYSEDRGDGALIVVPPEIPTTAVIDPMIALLGARLRRHNHRSSEAVRIQLRVAVDVGPVVPDPPGLSGWTIINAARLLDAAPLRARLAATRADLGVIVSRFVHDSAIAHGPLRVNAGEYEPVSCRVKETDIEGWIHLRGLPARSAA